MNLSELQNKLAALPQVQFRAETLTFPAFKAGEIHEVETGHDDFNMVVILQNLEDNLLSVAPFSLVGEMAGPEDVFLPIDAWGQEASVILECEFTVHQKTLIKPIAKLANEDIDYLLRARTANEADQNKNLFNWGWNYIDEKDLSYQFHDAVTGCIEKLQLQNRNQASVNQQSTEPICITDALKKADEQMDAAARGLSDIGQSRLVAFCGTSLENLKEFIQSPQSQFADFTDMFATAVKGKLEAGPVKANADAADISWDMSQENHCTEAWIIDQNHNILGIAHSIEDAYLEVKEWFGNNAEKINDLSKLSLIGVWN